MRTEVFTPQEILEAAIELEKIYSSLLLSAIIAGKRQHILAYQLRLSWVQDTIVYLEERI